VCHGVPGKRLSCRSGAEIGGRIRDELLFTRRRAEDDGPPRVLNGVPCRRWIDVYEAHRIEPIQCVGLLVIRKGSPVGVRRRQEARVDVAAELIGHGQDPASIEHRLRILENERYQRWSLRSWSQIERP
jgi:hypothetical protein